MIERTQLLIRPWRSFEPGGLPGWDGRGWGRAIAEVEDGTTLGFVRAVRLTRWPWLAPQQLYVLETEDASLLITLESPWFSFGRWHVVDAENRRLGSVLPPHVLDGDGFRFGRVEVAAPEVRSIRSVAGQTLATITLRGEETLLAFAPDVDANPFVRMLVLGVVLLAAPIR